MSLLYYIHARVNEPRCRQSGEAGGSPMPFAALLTPATASPMPGAGQLLLSTALLDLSAQSAPTLPSARPPEWAGWLGLFILIAAVSLLAWWLLASPLARPAERVAPTEHVLRMRFLMAAVVLLGGLLLRVGAPWDELWHRLSGVPFGEDLLWPPHLLMYASIALSFLLVGYGLSVALGGGGGLREGFRREPLLALLGLLSAYGFAFIPVDIVWHQVIGPDLMAESPPHVVGALSGTAVALTGVALALSTAPRPVWRGFLNRLRPGDAVALGILVVQCLSWLQLMTTGWEWAADRSVLSRPGWMYPVTVLVIGAAVSHVALYSTRRMGAATAVALVILAAHVPAVAVYRLLLPPGPAIAAHLLLVPAAVSLDVWYSLRRGDRIARTTLWGGAVLYAAVLLAVAIPYIARAMTVPVVDSATAFLSVAVGLPAALVASLLGTRVGAWLAAAGRPPATETAMAVAHPAYGGVESASHRTRFVQKEDYQ
ncbi:MAG: hypothetical protein GEU75_17730 [Dehalococcoidia bacterium]|nr:hypothetical protein [Dehalococcoidia bacterium]